MKGGARFALALCALLAGAALTARLGVWQLDRAAQKEALQAEVMARGALPPLVGSALSAKPAQALAQQVHRRVLLRGHWLHQQTIFLDNRPMQGRVGFFVLTPLQLEGRPEAVLVQRGWTPRDALDRSRLPDLPLTDQAVEVQGRLLAGPSTLYEFAGAAGGAIRQNLNVSAFADEIKIPLLPLTVLQLDPPSDGLLRAWVAPDAGLQKHYGYAFQWFALSALFLLFVGIYVWFKFFRSRHVST